MPSHPPDTSWDFGPVINLIDSDVHNVGCPTLRSVRVRPLDDVSEDGGVRLGSFTKIFESLGLPESAPLPPLDPDSELSNSDDALLPSPVVDVPLKTDKQAEDTQEEPLANITVATKKQRQKARKRAEKEQQEQENRERVIQETLNQLREDREQNEHQKQTVSLRKQLDDLADVAAVETPSKATRAHSRSNVGAKLRPASPSPVVPMAEPEALSTQAKKPKTPKRPSILKRPSTTQLATHRPVPQAPAVVPSTEPALTNLHDTTLRTPAPEPVFQLQIAQPVTPSGQHGLIPRTVRPATLPRTTSQPTVSAQPPTTPTRYATRAAARSSLTIRSQVDRHLHLYNRLLDAFPEDRKWLVSPMQLLSERTSAQGLHVFVDASNIMIGLKDMLRNHGLHHNSYDLSFDSLALLMERRRPVAKKFYAGSHREANPLPHIAKLVETSKAVGYDTVMQEQVLIVREESEKKKFFNDVKKMGWYRANQLRSGSGSDSETGPVVRSKTPPAPKWVEQGVDEILHLKMCQSIIDCEVPSTMVLATGDGAVAEMSDGFLAHVERALKKGWKVELVSWGQQTNSGYKKAQFRAKWAKQFTIIELDEFLEDLIDTP